MVVNVILVWW